MVIICCLLQIKLYLIILEGIQQKVGIDKVPIKDEYYHAIFRMTVMDKKINKLQISSEVAFEDLMFSIDNKKYNQGQ